MDEVTLTEEENLLMVTILTEVSRKIVIVHPLKGPQSPEVGSVNKIKSLDSTTFPVQSRNTEKILSDLRTLGLLNDVCWQKWEIKLDGMTKLRTAMNV